MCVCAFNCANLITAWLTFDSFLDCAFFVVVVVVMCKWENIFCAIDIVTQKEKEKKKRKKNMKEREKNKEHLVYCKNSQFQRA